MTTDEFLRRARELRSAADAAEHRFLQFLCECEHERGIWDGSGLTYPTFLDRHNIVKASRYLQFRQVFETLGMEETSNVGVNAVVAAGAFKDAEHQREVLDECRKIEETNGTATSEQAAQRVGRDLKQRDAGIRGRHRSYAVLLEENERIKAECKRLRDKVIALESELKALRPKGRRTAAPAAELAR